MHISFTLPGHVETELQDFVLCIPKLLLAGICLSCNTIGTTTYKPDKKDSKAKHIYKDSKRKVKILHKKTSLTLGRLSRVFIFFIAKRVKGTCYLKAKYSSKRL